MKNENYHEKAGHTTEYSDELNDDLAATLPEALKTVYIMSICGKTSEEISYLLSIPVITVRNRIRATKAIIKKNAKLNRNKLKTVDI